jgi:hypothetical protein
MRLNLAFLSAITAAAVLAAGLAAQQEPTPGASFDGGASGVLQSIYIPPMHNAAFTAIVHTEWARPMAGGGSTTLVNQRTVARDLNGRIYQERWLLVPKGGSIQSLNNLKQIYDPNEHTGYDCFLIGPQKDHCELHNYAGIIRTDPPVKSGPVGKAGFRTHEELGTRNIEGIETTGSRDTITYNAGVFGNDRPVRVIREYWHSDALGLNLISILDDPRIGKETFTLSDVSIGDPDPRLFDIPEGFQIVDTRQPEEPAHSASNN